MPYICVLIKNLQHELLAIHQANTPQFYPECAQLEITGSGSATPTDEYLVTFPGMSYAVGLFT